VIVFVVVIIREDVLGLCVQHVTVITAVHTRAYASLFHLEFGRSV